MADIETLYYDKKFDRYISKLADMRNLLFDDLKQDAFEEMLKCGVSDPDDCKRALRRVADRKREVYDPNPYSFDENLDEEPKSVRGEIKDWYWIGVDPRMNEDVDPELAWV